MLPLQSFLAFASLLGPALSSPTPLESLANRRTFSLEQVPVRRASPWRGPVAMQRTYLKYGVQPPEHVRIAAAVGDAEPGQTSVGVRPVKGDVEFLISVKVGNHNLSLDLDTGSSDLWVFSTLQPNEQRVNRPVNRVYDPKGSNAKQLTGHTWQIRYGDMSGANGQVYLDSVALGGLTVQNQAVEAAASVSRTFTRDSANDGLIGLAFSKLNTVKPTAQKTWFDNVKAQLAQPVFTCTLKRRAVGTYDFGYIDKSKYRGDLIYVNVTGTRGFWNFDPPQFAIGSNEPQNAVIKAIVDTGTSLWYMPRAVADLYWGSVPGAGYNTLQAGYTFPCNAKLPDMSLMVAGNRLTVPGINMNYQSVSSTLCYGGIQRDTGMPFSIFGDVFLKGVFVVFESAPGVQPRLGFAQQVKS